MAFSIAVHRGVDAAAALSHVQAPRSRNLHMGYETRCAVRVDDGGAIRSSNDATVLLETDELIVRGEARVRLPRAAIQQVTVRGGRLTVTATGVTLSLALGAASAKWKEKLEEPPKRLIDKLYVKSGARVWLLALPETGEDLAGQIAERTTQLSVGSKASGCDVVFVGVDREGDLSRIERARKAIHDHGAIWVVHPKGAAGVADTVIFAAAKRLGLVYTKVARVSATHSAEKLVVPVAARSVKPSAPRRRK